MIIFTQLNCALTGSHMRRRSMNPQQPPGTRAHLSKHFQIWSETTFNRSADTTDKAGQCATAHTSPTCPRRYTFSRRLGTKKACTMPATPSPTPSTTTARIQAGQPCVTVAFNNTSASTTATVPPNSPGSSWNARFSGSRTCRMTHIYHNSIYCLLKPQIQRRSPLQQEAHRVKCSSNGS